MISLGSSLVLYSLSNSSRESSSCGGISIGKRWIDGDMFAICRGPSWSLVVGSGLVGGVGVRDLDSCVDSGGGWKGRSGVRGRLADTAGEVTDGTTGGKFRIGKSDTDMAGFVSGSSKSSDLRKATSFSSCGLWLSDVLLIRVVVTFQTPNQMT